MDRLRAAALRAAPQRILADLERAQLALQLQVAEEALRGEPIALDRPAHGAPRLVAVAAVGEAARRGELADVLERVLDKGVVIVGDIKIKLVDIELLTIQIRLMIASVDKAKEMGMDWWIRNPAFAGGAEQEASRDEFAEMRKRVEQLEGRAGLPAGAGARVEVAAAPPG